MPDRVLELMERAARARRENRLVHARRDLVGAVALCREAGARRHLVDALKRLGQVERDLTKAEAARAAYEEAVGLCRGEDDALLLAHTVRHLGDVHQDAGRPDLAEPCYCEALALYRGHEETRPLDLANAIRSLAMLKERSGELGEAVVLWKEAHDLYTSARVEEGAAECSAHVARLRRSTARGGCRE
jgi:tetratricopeptide (TPR) repeat protein